MMTTASETPLLTIAVCTWNRAELLRDCLDSVVAQQSISSAYEVLIIDNGSSDNTQVVCKEYVGKLPGFRSVVELKTGLSHARNRAVAEAAGTAIAFVDDDAILCDNWLRVVEKTLLRDDYAAFGGPYDAWHRYGPPPAWFKDEWESNILDSADGPLAQGQYPSGGNCVISLNWCRRLGGFSTKLGMEGNKIRYGEESELFERIRSAGGTLGWANEMLVHHCVRQEKYGFFWRIKSSIARGRDYVSVVSPSFSLKRLLWRVVCAAYAFGAFCIRFLCARITSRCHFWQTDFFDCGTAFFAAIGAVIGELCLPLRHV